MSLKNSIMLYVLTLVVFFLIDMIWLGLVARNFYRSKLGDMLNPKVNWTAAILFYLLFIAGLQLFVIVPALAKGSPLQALWQGALFGLVAYATYDLTNLATLRGWPVLVTIVDLAWGAILGGSVSFLSSAVASRLLRS